MSYSMPLRGVAPLDEKQWAQVQEMMKAGPTDETIALGKKALERASKIKRNF